MARPANTMEMATLTMTVTPHLKYYLEKMGARGLFVGTTAADVAKQILSEHVREMMFAGKIKEEDLVVENGKAKPADG
jgi:hypothetical protein